MLLLFRIAVGHKTALNSLPLRLKSIRMEWQTCIPFEVLLLCAWVWLKSQIVRWNVRVTFNAVERISWKIYKFKKLFFSDGGFLWQTRVTLTPFKVSCCFGSCARIARYWRRFNYHSYIGCLAHIIRDKANCKLKLTTIVEWNGSTNPRRIMIRSIPNVHAFLFEWNGAIFLLFIW